MCLPLIPPTELTTEQRGLYEDMRNGISSNFNASKAVREDGALMGPWNPWLHEPGIGKAIWDLTLAMTANATLPDNVRQIVILVVGARFDAAYEIYAHIAVAEHEAMRPARLATLVADLKPNNLSDDESVAFDVAYKLVRGGTLPEALYRLAVDTFGQHGTNEMIYLVGLYCPGVDDAQRLQRAGPRAGIGPGSIRVFVVGVTIFAVASVWCASSSTGGRDRSLRPPPSLAPVYEKFTERL